MTASTIFLLSFLLPMAGMALIPVLPHKARPNLGLVFVILTAVITSLPALRALMENKPVQGLYASFVFASVPLQIDSLSAWFILIINLTCVTGALYGIGYLRPYHGQRANLSLHWIWFLLFQTSMVWVCMIQNALLFLIAWELMSISSFLLVIFEHEKKMTLKAGINYLVQMHIGVLFLSAAFIWVYLAQGSLEFSAIASFFGSHSNIGLFLLFFIGFGIKAGFVPLHSWLPEAHPAAPSHISGVMSGVIVKLGIYGIFRIVFYLKADYTVLGEFMIMISLLTGLYGILNAAVQRDFKKMLAYCTIENMGIIGMGIGLGLLGLGSNQEALIILGFGGALLHVLNHSLYKSQLFFSAGAVYQQTHTRDIEKLGGLIRSMPQSGFLFLMGALAIGGLPPFNGFVSEFLLYFGFLKGLQLINISLVTLVISSIAGIALIGGVSIFTFSKNFASIFLGNPRSHLPTAPREVSRTMLLAQYAIIILMLSIGIFPGFYFSIIYHIVSAVIPTVHPGNIIFQSTVLGSLQLVGIGSLVFVALATGVYFLRNYFTRNKSTVSAPTWGCGYPAANTRMQYTGKSFSKSLSKLFSFLVIEKKKYHEIGIREIFPLERRYGSSYHDYFVKRLIDPVVDRLLYALNYFGFIQNGRIQMYMLYGIFFIVLIFLGTVFKLI